MTIWVDAQLSPLLAKWIGVRFGVPAVSIRDLGLRDSKDIDIFRAARKADVIVLTKDADFPHLLSQHGPPPRVLWLTCGNTSNVRLQQILAGSLPKALEFLKAGEALVQISGPTSEWN